MNASNDGFAVGKMTLMSFDNQQLALLLSD